MEPIQKKHGPQCYFGKLLEHYYREKGIENQTELYYRLSKKYTRPSISKYANGKIAPSKQFVHDIQLTPSLTELQVEMLWLAHGLDMFTTYANEYGGL